MPKTTKITKAKTTKIATKKAAQKVVAKPTKKVAAIVASGISVPTFTTSGESTTAVSVDQAFTVKANQALLTQAIRVYQANQHFGLSSTKTRGEVTGSTRKIYRQKGTGRARHGAITAPIFVGGGIVHGPRPRNMGLDLPKKMRQQVFAQALSERINEQNVRVVSGLFKASGKTRDMAALLAKMDVADKKVLLIVTDKMDQAVQASRNIPTVMIQDALTVSAYDILLHKVIVIAEEAFEVLKKRLPESKKV
ncbi:50S ribosomal protein L4 [Candidatus Microgenomates bacterium]|nr:MAG: 50S ribosomal protein L4 [Candidatus Microgenomates bacterium]